MVRSLQEKWAKKGNPLCEHPRLDEEYMQGMDTGDYVCTICGKSFHYTQLEQDPDTHRLRPKSD